MSSKLGIREVGSICWEAAKTYFVPLGLLGIIIKLYIHLPLWQILVLASGLFIFSLWRIGRQFKRNKQQEESISVYESLVRLRQAERECIDEVFQYHSIVRQLFVDRPNAFVRTIEEGTNKSDTNQQQIIRAVTADTPIDFDALKFKAWFRVDGNDQIASITPCLCDVGRTYIVKIGFHSSVVEPNNKVKIRCEFGWPGCLARNEDHWVFALNNFRHTVGYFKLETYFTEIPADNQLSVFTEGTLQPIGMDGPIKKTVSINGNEREWQCYTAEISNPDIFYVVKWRIK